VKKCLNFFSSPGIETKRKLGKSLFLTTVKKFHLSLVFIIKLSFHSMIQIPNALRLLFTQSRCCCFCFYGFSLRCQTLCWNQGQKNEISSGYVLVTGMHVTKTHVMARVPKQKKIRKSRNPRNIALKRSSEQDSEVKSAVVWFWVALSCPKHVCPKLKLIREAGCFVLRSMQSRCFKTS
jgi:hypothetical protein